MVALFIICLISVMLTYSILRCLQRLDMEAQDCRSCSLLTQTCLCIISCEAVCFFWKLQKEKLIKYQGNVMIPMLLAVLAACLLAASIMDLESYLVYNYVWWVGGSVALVFLCAGSRKTLGELVIYILLQELLFSKMYGRADCHAFVVCGMLQASWGMSMQAYLTHMLLAFVLLAVVQGFDHNIARNGNLKQPVAFLPYITVSFWSIAFVYVAVC